MNSNHLPAGNNETEFRWLAALAIVLVGFLTYANTLTGEFVWDDVSSVLLHEHVKDPSKFFQLFLEDQHAFGRGQGNFYRPLVSVSFMADYVLSAPAAGESLSPFLFHLQSIMWHLAASVLLFILLGRLGAAPWLRLFVALIYVVHPLHTEAVAYISGRADPMSAAFMFGGLAFIAGSPSRTSRPAPLALSLLCFTGALLSKESSFIYPALAFLVIRFGPREEGATASLAQRYLPVIGSLVVLAAYGALRFLLLDLPTASQTAATGLGSRLSELAKAFALYAELLFVPVGLHMERALDGVPGWVAAAGAVLLILVLFFTYRAIRNGDRITALGLSWFLVTWLPVSGLFPLNAPMAEHWMYVPLAGALLALGEVFRRSISQPTAVRVVVAATAVWGLFLFGRAVDRNLDWRNNEALYRATLRENPDTLRVRYNLAVTYEELVGNTAGAKREFQEFLERYQAQGAPSGLREAALESHLSLGNLYLNQNQYSQAATHFQTVQEQSRQGGTAGLFGMAAYGMGRIHLAYGQREQAMQQFRAALQVEPNLRGAVEQALSRSAAGI